MKQQLEHALQKALVKLGIETADAALSHTEDLKMGDYTSNAAMVYAKQLKVNPKILAQKITEELNTILPQTKKVAGRRSDIVARAEVAGPGFINFFLHGDVFTHSIDRIRTELGDFGTNHLYKGKKVMIEHTNLNPFKPFHIGHLVNHTVGESISRFLENSGAEVKRVSYGGDVGLHVAKSMWGMLQVPYKSGEEVIEYLGSVYAAGSASYETDESVQKEIKDINAKIYNRSDTKINELYDWGKAESLKYFDTIYKKLDVHFSYQFFESEVAPIGMFLVEEFLTKGVFEKSEGAIVFKGEQYGLHTRVFVNSQGLPTYETKELGLTKKKADLYTFDLSIVVTANEQSDYFKVLLKVIEFVFPSIANRMRHISHGLLRFSDGKMSSRKGNIITGESLITDVEKLVGEKIADRELNVSEKKDIEQKVAIAAIKYSILRQSPGSDIVFDREKSLSFEGDSGPYLQYATVRAQRVLEKAQQEGIVASTALPFNPPLDLDRLLIRYEEVVVRATTTFSPQLLATYLIDLAAAFNAYYADIRLVDKNNEYSPFYIALTQAFTIVMKNGLSLLGIPLPEKM